MKKTIFIITTFIVLIATIIPTVIFASGSASMSMSGPSTVKAGDTITVNVNANMSNIGAMEFRVSYNKNQLTLVGNSPNVPNGRFNEATGKFAFYGDTINASKSVLSLTFKVANLNVNDTINVSIGELIVGDANGDAVTGNNASYLAKIVANPDPTPNPPSESSSSVPNPPEQGSSNSSSLPSSSSSVLPGNANLSSLFVNNAELSPKFKTDLLNYNVSVPFDTTTLNIIATAQDAKSKIEIANNDLKPDATTVVSIKVTAPQGATKTYKISAKRAADPNAPSSEVIPPPKDGNNFLSSIGVDVGILSPIFDKNIYKYIVYLPYEVEKIKLTANAESSLSTLNYNAENDLVIGDNVLKLSVAAENGDTLEYEVLVVRAEKYNGELILKDVEFSEEEMNVPKSGLQFKMVYLYILIAIIVAIGFGFLMGMFFTRDKKITKKLNNKE